MLDCPSCDNLWADFFKIPFNGFSGKVQELNEELRSLDVVGTSIGKKAKYLIGVILDPVY